MTHAVRGAPSLRSSALVLVPYALLLGLVSPNAAAQIITPRTVPVHMNQQFDILPSDRSGTGGVTIAMDDALLDPFVNPAKATRSRAGRVSVAPFFHSVSESRGGGRTLPVSGAGSFGRWAAGGLFAIQQLDRPSNWNAPISERTASNQYVSAILARTSATASPSADPRTGPTSVPKRASISCTPEATAFIKRVPPPTFGSA